MCSWMYYYQDGACLGSADNMSPPCQKNLDGRVSIPLRLTDDILFFPLQFVEWNGIPAATTLNPRNPQPQQLDYERPKQKLLRCGSEIRFRWTNAGNSPDRPKHCCPGTSLPSYGI